MPENRRVMDVLGNPRSFQPPTPRHSAFRRRYSFTRPVYLIPTAPSASFRSIRALSSSSSSLGVSPNPEFREGLVFVALKTLIRSTCIVVVSTAVFFASSGIKPIFASPVATEPAQESNLAVSDEELERILDENDAANPNDVDTLKDLLGVKMKLQKFDDALKILDRLTLFEPNEIEWTLMKSQIYVFRDDYVSAKPLLERVVEKDPFRVDAHHGLLLVASQFNKGAELKSVTRRIMKLMQVCKKEGRNEELRDFKMLVAQIRMIEGSYAESKKIYEELVKDDPNDYRPYLCLGLVYGVMRDKDNAEKHFQKFRRLLPPDHPYAGFLDEAALTAQVFPEIMERQQLGKKSS